MRVTLLGTGTSTGVPVIGCDCRVCRSSNPRDKRLRCACLIEITDSAPEAGRLSLLIDAGPDFRQQALRFDIRRLDAVLFTHAHFDHVVGVDDLRPFFYENKTPIPCYARASTAEVLRRMFPYIFVHDRYKAAPRLELREVEAPFEVESRYHPDTQVQVEPVEVFHGESPILGYRIGRFAYLTDTSRIPESSFERLHGLDVLVLDALRHRSHPTHFTIKKAVETAQRIGARKTYFIHLTHDILHAEEEERLPESIHLGYDGLSFTVRHSTSDVRGC